MGMTLDRVADPVRPSRRSTEDREGVATLSGTRGLALGWAGGGCKDEDGGGQRCPPEGGRGRAREPQAPRPREWRVGCGGR